MSGLHLADALLPALALLALLGGWLALRRATRAQRTTGLPAGRVVYADTGDWRPPDAPFFSAAHRLTGKPDYLVKTRAGLIPVEVKSSTAPAQPYPSHVLQLAAYCLLVEEAEGRIPPYGLIQYANTAFEVDYTDALRRELLALLDNMRQARQSGATRSHDESRRCAGCGYRQVCDQSLA
jgi:CRISPR-associated exonuclease Cas4